MPIFLLFEKKIKNLNHSMVWVGRNFKDHLVPSPCHEQGHLPLDQVAQSSIQPGLEHCQGGASTASLSNLCQCLITLIVKNFFLISSLNLPSFSFKPLPLLLSLHALVKSLSPMCLQVFNYFKAQKFNIIPELYYTLWQRKVRQKHN